MPDRHESAHNPLAQVPTHELIHRIRRDLIHLIDTPLSLDSLQSPRVIYSLLRPLEQAYLELDNVAIIYALMANRMRFLNEQMSAAALHSVSATRARVCAILATNILRCLFDRQLGDEEKSYTEALLPIARILVGGFSPWQGASTTVIEKVRAWKGPDWAGPNEVFEASTHGKGCALELAILSEAKFFVRSPTVQAVVDSIWRGKLQYSPSSWIDLIPNNWKRTQLSIYNARAAPLLDHSRLTVPWIRARLEICHFLVLMALWIAALQAHRPTEWDGWEALFMLYGLGFSLDKFATSLEHGWGVFSANLTNPIDAGLCFIHTVYTVLRLIDFAVPTVNGHSAYAKYAFQAASLGPILLFPRLAFLALADNLLILSIRAMISKFIYLTLLAIWCFCGFLYTLHFLAKQNHLGLTYSYISKLMIYLWLGLDGEGIDRSSDFHRPAGPIIVVAFAALANNLVVSIVIAILSHTFRGLSEDASAEALFMRTVTTFEGKKSDAIFNYQIPLNIPALLILTPIRLLTTPRRFHSIVVFSTRVLNFPILLLIALVERGTLAYSIRFPSNREPAPSQSRRGIAIESSAHADIARRGSLTSLTSTGCRLSDRTRGSAGHGTGRERVRSSHDPRSQCSFERRLSGSAGRRTSIQVPSGRAETAACFAESVIEQQPAAQSIDTSCCIWHRPGRTGSLERYAGPGAEQGFGSWTRQGSVTGSEERSGADCRQATRCSSAHSRAAWSARSIRDPHPIRLARSEHAATGTTDGQATRRSRRLNHCRPVHVEFSFVQLLQV